MYIILRLNIEVYKLFGDNGQKKKKISGWKKGLDNPTRVLFGHELQESKTLTRYDLDYYFQILNVVKFDLFLKNNKDA